MPAGEIFPTDAELEWAWQIRAHLPRNRPVLLLSSGSITGSLVVSSSGLMWQQLVEALRPAFTMVQAAVTRLERIEEVTRVNDRPKRAWRPDPILDECFILENLPIRQFFALFAISDLLLGTNSGGAHVAAAILAGPILEWDAEIDGRAPEPSDVSVEMLGRGFVQEFYGQIKETGKPPKEKLDTYERWLLTDRAQGHVPDEILVIELAKALRVSPWDVEHLSPERANVGIDSLNHDLATKGAKRRFLSF